MTEDVMAVGLSPWLMRVAAAIAKIWRCALVVRLIRTSMVSSGDAWLPPAWSSWADLWCGFLCNLKAVARSLPRAGLVLTALNTSAAAVIQDELPRVLAASLHGLAHGRVTMDAAAYEIDNATQVFTEYIDYAVLLGEEALGFGDRRVGRAVFHGEASNSGAGQGRINRLDVILWLLAGGELGLGGDNVLRSPHMAELGVNTATLPQHLLTAHPSLHWLGVDPYEGSIWTPGGNFKEAAEILANARARLRPFGARAELLVARSLDPADADLGHRAFDLLFVDGLHDEASAIADIVKWAPRVRPGGIVSGHDYRTGYRGVAQAAHACLPRGATLHLAPDSVFWWRLPRGPPRRRA